MDRINSTGSAGSFPINAALRAYAQAPRVNKPGGSPYAQSAQPLRPTAPATTVRPARQLSPTDSLARISPSKPALDSSSITQLVGAKVQPINLSSDVATIKGPKPVTTSAGTYTMYPQHADRNQAATNVAANVSLGRSLDLNG